ncbi:MAG: hypothetical protein JWO09_872 [Bacteroidetes bacterium]|nr:hypothetical protein [Bacteroidota bacterium]
MKKALLLFGMGIILITSCGPNAEEIKQQKIAAKKAHIDSVDMKMAQIKELRKSVLKHMKYMDDCVIHYGLGRVGTGDDIIVELTKFHWGAYEGTVMPKEVCECPMDYEGDVAYPFQAVLNFKCIRFKSKKISNPVGNVNLDGEVDEIYSPKFIPPGDSWIAAYKLGTIEGKRYQIGDMAEFKKLKSLIEETKNEEQNKKYDTYYEINCFNDNFDDIPRSIKGINKVN